MEFVTLSTLPGIIGRYLMMLKVTDILDIAIMVFVFYKALTLIQSTRAASLLKGVLVFLAALMLSMVLNMNSINFIMNQLVRWGVVALIVLFQPEIRRILEEAAAASSPSSPGRRPAPPWNRPSTRRCWPAPRCPSPAPAL